MSLPTLEQFKQEARELRVLKGLRSCVTHEILAKSYGFKSYATFRAKLKEVPNDPTPT